MPLNTDMKADMKTDSRNAPYNRTSIIVFLCGLARGLPLATVVLLAACAGLPGEGSRLTKAQDIAAQGHLTRRVIPTGPFDITLFTKMDAPGQPISVYIEGDGLAWLSRTRPSGDPSPTNPIALRLAAADLGPNVIYMARPCQYSRGAQCAIPYWTQKRFAPEIIAAMDTALNRVLGESEHGKIRLIGFSGGGAVAALMAAKRDDVLDLRSVAGNMNPAAHSMLHKVSPLDGSLNPVDFAATLRHIPQHHFIGGADKNIPVSLYESYATALGDTACTAHTVIPGITHEKGWDDAWGRLQSITPICQ